MPSVVGKQVGAIGYGLMGLTWRSKPAPQDQAFKAMRAALNAGANFWNGGEFYGPPKYNSLVLLDRYFNQYPEDLDKVVISMKGGLKANLTPDGSPEGVRRSVDNTLQGLGKKSLDLFECARVDPKTPIETTIQTLAEYVQAGKLKGISLSEVKAETIRRAHKVHPISAVEIELSLWATEPLTNGIVDTCAELDIPIVAYSPIGRGFLTGQIKSLDDLPADDMRRHFPRFQRKNFERNIALVNELEKLADRKGCTPAQLAISWVCSLSETNGRGVIIPIPGATTAERVQENTQHVELTETDFKEIQDILEKAEVVGGRYGGPGAALMNG
ncbi:MAG: hypothetical protein M1823_002926 [Watsoniomyces obsoletus]|nr:MAG: hypothetical protein M1823_002926 [Watsoniomyces obsoletus]